MRITFPKMSKIQKFEDIQAWQNARKAVNEIYKMTKFSSFSKDFSLKDQRAGPTVFALSALYLMAVGLYPLPSMEHIDLSALFFIAFPFGFVLFGLRNLNDAIPFKKKMSIFALAVFIIAAFSSVLLLIFNGIAIPEILIFFPGIIWFMIYGFYLIFYKNS